MLHYELTKHGVISNSLLHELFSDVGALHVQMIRNALYKLDSQRVQSPRRGRVD